MKSIEVAAAIIKQDEKIFVTQRKGGTWKDYWEFPGGKIEEGETKEEALIREITEELDIEIEHIEYFDTITYQYPDFFLTLYCFFCTIKSGIPKLLEHKNAKWLLKEELESVKWLPANSQIIQKIQRLELLKEERK